MFFLISEQIFNANSNRSILVVGSPQDIQIFLQCGAVFYKALINLLLSIAYLLFSPQLT